MILRITPVAALALLSIVPARAQPGPAETGTGGGPASTVTAPHTTSVGQTKPPGAAAGGTTSDTREQRTATEKKDDAIMKGICIGCGAR